MRYIFLFILFLFTIGTYAQDFKISGKLVDSISRNPIESATVFVTKLADTSLIAYTLSDDKGNFSLKGKSESEKIQLNISYIGYKPYSNIIQINKEGENILDSIFLAAKIESLDEVLIKGITPPIVFKNDTIEFNVNSFKADENAYLEDFLKILPGFQVNSRGDITFNGKPVEKVMVNGKRFFDDPKLATQNLSKGLIEKIQVLDSRSKSQVFTGEKSDGKAKTINLEIAPENNKGFFGNIAAAGGTKERYQVNGTGNYFNNEMRLSLIATGNNVRDGHKDYSNVMGNMGPPDVGGGGGINRSQSLASNYVDEWSDHLDFNGNYRYQNDENFREQKRRSENRLPNNERFYNESIQNSSSGNETHTFNSAFETTLDSVYLIQFRPSFSYSEGHNSSTASQLSLNDNEELRNSSESVNNSRNFNKRFSNNLIATRKYGKRGGYVQLVGNLSFNTNESALENESEIRFFNTTGGAQVLDSVLIRDQYRNGNQDNVNQDYTLKWKVPLNTSLSLIPSYKYISEIRTNEFLIYDREGITTVLNANQSTDYKNRILEHGPGIGMEYLKNKIHARMSFAPVFRYLESTETFNSINFSNNFSTVEFSSNLSYKINNSAGLNLVYSFGNSVPGITQLSPYIDNTDPLHIIRGNPDLEPSSSNLVQLNFSDFNMEKKSNLHMVARFMNTNNAVINKTSIGEDLVRHSTYVNVDGNYNFGLDGTYRKNIQFDSIQHFSYSFQSSYNVDNRTNYINEELYRSSNKTLSSSVSVTYMKGFGQRYVLSYGPRLGINSFNSEYLNDTEFLTHNLSLSGVTKIWKILLTNSFSYTYNPNIAEDFSKNSFSWNSSLQLVVLDKKGAITFDAYDILNKNVNASRYSSGESIIDVENSIQRRYFMLGFRYRFNTGGKSPPNSFNIMY